MNGRSPRRAPRRNTTPAGGRDDRAARAARRYALLLRLYPRRHREAFGAQMAQTFEDQYRDHLAREGRAGWAFWLGVAADEGRSLVREHAAALGAGATPMKKWLGIGLAAWLALFFLPVPFPPWNLLRWGLLVALYCAAPFVVIWRFVRAIPPGGAGAAGPWARLAPTLGGIVVLYVVADNLRQILLPSPAGPESGLLLGLQPLLAAVVGLIGGYVGGRAWQGILAGLLVGVVGMVVGQACWVLLVALLWPAIQHGQVRSGLVGDFLRYTAAAGRALSLRDFLNLELFEDGVGLPLTFFFINLAVEGLSAAVGGALGVALRRAGDARPPPAPPRPARFVLEMLALGLVMWAGAVEFGSMAGAHHLLSPRGLWGSFAGPGILAWLLGFAAMLACLYVGTRRDPAY